ncbi:MAG: rimL [Pedosphaera sp.]|nr:rimL [Pedosphaera sp.]
MLQTDFTGGRVGIRRFRTDDIPLLFEAARESINELSAWMVWCHPGYSVADSASFISGCCAEWDRGGHFSFVIHDVRDGAFLGSVGLNQVNRIHSFANIGYWVRTSCTGQGVAAAATRLIAQFGLQELGLNRLELLVPTGNQPSQRVAEKTGAKLEGVLRKRLLLQGAPHDAALYSLVAEDLQVSTHRKLAAHQQF